MNGRNGAFVTSPPRQKRILYKERIKKEKNAQIKSLNRKGRLERGQETANRRIIAFRKLRCAVCGNAVTLYNTNIYHCKKKNYQKSIEREHVERDAFADMEPYRFDQFGQSVREAGSACR